MRCWGGLLRRSERGEGEGQRLTAFLGLDRDKRHLKVWWYETNKDTHTHTHERYQDTAHKVQKPNPRLYSSGAHLSWGQNRHRVDIWPPSFLGTTHLGLVPIYSPGKHTHIMLSLLSNNNLPKSSLTVQHSAQRCEMDNDARDRISRHQNY